MFVVCSVVTGPCDKLVTRPEKPSVYLIFCTLETSAMRRPSPDLGFCARGRGGGGGEGCESVLMSGVKQSTFVHLHCK